MAKLISNFFAAILNAIVPGSWIKAEPDLAESCERIAARGIQIKAPALWHQLNNWGLSFKKTLHASEQGRADVQQSTPVS